MHREKAYKLRRQLCSLKERWHLEMKGTCCLSVRYMVMIINDIIVIIIIKMVMITEMMNIRKKNENRKKRS